VLGASRRRQLQPIKRVSLNGKRYPNSFIIVIPMHLIPPFVISVLSA